MCGYNYGLKWLYGQDVSSSINSRFCVYCTHSTGIYIPLQKIHDDKVIKLYMSIILEEVRAYQSVMAWGMVFGVVVPEVSSSGGLVNLEVAMAGAIPDPVEAHVNILRPFLLYCIVCKNHCCGVIYLHGSGGFGMSNFLKGQADW